MQNRVLLVDDDEQIVTSLREHFASFGYEVDFAYELDEALGLIDRLPYDAIITDMRLERSGFAGLQVIKAAQESPFRTHIVVLTGHAWPELEDAASAHGLCVFLQKPVRAAQVLKTINLLVGVSE